MTQASEDQIKVVEDLKRKYSRYPHPEDLRYKNALTALLTEFHEMREMLEAATEIHFEGDDTSIRRLGGKPYEYGVVVEGDYGRGDYSTALDAFAEVKKGEGKQ